MDIGKWVNRESLGMSAMHEHLAKEDGATILHYAVWGTKDRRYVTACGIWRGGQTWFHTVSTPAGGDNPGWEPPPLCAPADFL